MSGNETIVCFSINAPPLNDSESFCTARFLTALALCGIKVHLVTVDHEQQLKQDIVDELLHENITITRISLDEINEQRTFSNLYNYVYYGQYSCAASVIVKKLKEILRGYDSPILITRSYPALSNIIGYLVSKYAKKWVAHYGDPFPGLGIYSRRSLYKYYIDLMWAREIFKKADIVTVTARNAVRHFVDVLRCDYTTKMHVTYHVGEPPLKYDGSVMEKKINTFNVVHVGYWSRVRFMSEVVSEFSEVHMYWKELNLMQYGKIENGSEYIIGNDNYSWLKVLSGTITSPRESSAVLAEADLNIVIDQNDGLQYCPFLASKFAYAVHSGKPVLGIGQYDSEMSMLSREYPSIKFANINNRGDLAEVMMSYKKSPTEDIVRPCHGIKKLFSREDVAIKFIEKVCV